MLRRITIKNLALIADAELEFSDKLNILSGETGAGKSIIVDALMLLMGGKYDKTMLSYGTDQGYVEGVFSFAEGEADAALEQAGLEPDTEMIVRRRFTADGKNDIRVNGRSCTAKMLKGLMSHFVDICGQNEYQVLAEKKEHIAILDAFAHAELAPVLDKMSTTYAEYTSLRKRMSDIGDAGRRLSRIDLLSFQIDEIEKANVARDEDDELLAFRSRAANSERIKIALGGASDALSGDNGSRDGVYEAVRQLASVAALSPEYAELKERLDTLSIELDDIADSIGALEEEVDFDESDLENAETRLRLLRNLKSKYGDLNALPEKLTKLRAELDVLQNSDEEYERLCSLSEKCLDALYDLSVKASDIRRKRARELAADVKRELGSLGMPNAEFTVAFTDIPTRAEAAEKVTPRGMDDVEFMLSPNIGQPLLPLLKIISGGEMSRFMLALKVISSRYANVGTMIFDEIDTGISGKIGQEVAKKLADISRNSQVLCVTHLAQIASMADTQYYIEKNTDGVTTNTSVRLLDRQGMIDEICRLSGARDVSASALKSAEELKAWSDDYKKNIKK